MKVLHKFKAQHLASVILAVLCLLAIVLPLTAQEGTTVETDEESTIIVTGAVSFGPSGDILVGGYIIAPASAFNPSSLTEGDVVIIIGRLLPDGLTVQAESFEFFDEPEATEEPEATPESTPEATPETTPEATPEATPESTPEATEEPETCGNPAHPVATRIAEEFEVSYAEVMAMHCDGNGFGNIVRAFLLAEAGGDASTAQDFLDRHHAGEGWGHIMRESGMHPSSFAPGRALKNKDNDEGEEVAPVTNQQSNGNGNGHGNGNNGNNGNGNGNGNGQGNGNSGGNGNGRGNGNGGGKGKGN